MYTYFEKFQILYNTYRCRLKYDIARRRGGADKVPIIL